MFNRHKLHGSQPYQSAYLEPPADALFRPLTQENWPRDRKLTEN